MKPIEEFLSDLRRLQVNLWLENGRLNYSAPEGTITPELLLQMRDRKPEILAFLQQVNSDSSTSIKPLPRQKTLPLSFAQQRLWFLDQLQPNNSTYNIPQAIRLVGTLDIDALQHAFNTIIERHEILRTRYVAVEEEPEQIISEHQTLEITRINLSYEKAEKQSAKLHAELIQQIDQPFNLSDDLLIRVTLIQLSTQERVLLIVIHHIAGDGWSINLLYQELATLYNSYISGQPLALPVLPIQYADFAAWQRNWLSGSVLEQHLNYWKTKLNDVVSLQLPTDFPRPAVLTFTGQHHIRTLPAILTAQLNALSQQQGATLFMTLLAAFKLLLGRLAGQDDIVVGSPIAGRDRPETTNLIGFFINTVVIRSKLAEDVSFCDFLQGIRQTTLEAYAHQDLPFEKLVEELQLERDLSRTPIFQVWVNMLNLDHAPPTLAGLGAKPLDLPKLASKFDVTLYMGQQGDEIKLRLVSNADLFLPQRMEEMLAQFEHLLRQVVAQPNQSVYAYSLVTPSSQLMLPNPTVPLTASPYPSVTTLIQTWVQRSPEQIAICQGEAVWSYRTLMQRAEQIAQALMQDGLAPGSTVAVVGDRSFGLIVSVVAVLLAGGVLLLIDPSLPKARQQRMLETAQAERAIAVGPLDHPEILKDCSVWHLQQHTGELVNTDCLPTNAIPLPSLEPSQPAYIFFTSGTTGTPKGVMGTHNGLSHFLRWQQQTFAVAPGDRVGQLTGLSFDVVLRDIFLPLTSGATLCLPLPEQRLIPTQLLQWLEDAQITLLHTVPTVAKNWLTDVPDGVSLHRLRYVFFAGEPLSDRLIQQWRQAFPEAGNIVNLYGPTETTLAKCYYPIGDEPLPGVQPVGTPLPDTQALVLSRNHQLCGVGEVGEIVLRSPFRTLGYINAPDEQQRRFVPNPFRQDKQDLVYYTGDLGRYRPDGILDILGRRDQQIKLRGVRIELGEIEAVLSQHPTIQQSVIAVQETPLGLQLLAYFMADAATPAASIPTSEELRQFLQNQLPDYMIPAAFVRLEALPLTPNGKIDRRALPQVNLAQQAIQGHESAFVAPRTAIEQRLAEIWMQVLKVEQVSIFDNFFELGGHSLIAAQVMGRIHKTLHIELPLRWLFEHQTIATLAEAIEQHIRTMPQQPSASPKADVALTRRCDRQPISLSFAQQRMWFLAQLEPNSPAYHIPKLLRFRGNLNVAALEQTLKAIVARHEVLHTNIVIQSENPVQVVNPEAQIHLVVTDLSDYPLQEQTTQLETLFDQDSRQVFDLTSDVKLRARLVRLNATTHALILVLHHIAADGWSMGVLVQELSAFYRAFCTDQPASLPELPVQYADYTLWQSAWLAGDMWNRQLDYWKQQLANAPALLALPSDRPRPAVQSYRGAKQVFTLPLSLSQDLQSFSQQQGVTLFMTLLAAFKLLLFRYSGQSDIVVGSPIAGRRYPELEGLVGFFVNTLALRTSLQGNLTFVDLLQRVKEVTLGAYDHQDLPFETLVETLQPQRDRSYSPLVQVMFVLQNAPQSSWSLDGLTVEMTDFDNGTAKFDVSLSLIETKNGLKGHLEYATDLFDAETIQRMISHFQTLLSEILVNPHQRLAELPLLTAAEQRQLLTEWNPAKTGVPPTRWVHQWFEDQVVRSPDAIAVVFEQEQLTYSELNRRANQLAHRLQSLGVKPEELVGICVERSLDMIVALLGVLKAGGAFVPLDPNYPLDRLKTIIQDAQISILLTHKRLASRISVTGSTLVFLDDKEAYAQFSQENPVSQVAANHLAYVTYTSGSTGQPKGVLIEHHMIARHCSSIAAQFKLTASDRVLQFASFAFDAALEQILPTLLVGATLILPDTNLWAPAEFSQKLVEFDISVADLPPVFWHQWVLSLQDTPFTGHSQLRLVVCGGDVMQIESVNLWRQTTFKSVRLLNAYGPTETTITATMFDVSKELDTLHLAQRVPIGRAVGDRTVYVLDQHHSLVPIGVSGELHIGGDCVARGYLNRAELTSAKFIPDPFSDAPNARLYKTGDMARYRPDGTIEFLGRVDHQVKIRGFRIELEEIETILAQHSAIKQCAVAARPDHQGEQRLVAYYVSWDEGLTPEALRQFLHQYLPNYMVPAAFVRLDALPLSTNGKLDRKMLPDPDASQIHRSTTFVLPRNAVEEELAQIWTKILKLERVGVHDNFFELGGHSLIAAQMIIQIRDRFQVDLPLRNLFETPTIAHLANHIVQQQLESLDQDVESLLSSLEAMSDEEVQQLY
jgi:amino acid adenylation domain-containing protein